MIEFYLTGKSRDHTKSEGRIHWGTIADGNITVDNTSTIDNPTSPFGDNSQIQVYSEFEDFITDYRESLFEGLEDPIAVLNHFSYPPVVAAIPAISDEGLIWTVDLGEIRSNGDLTDRERAEVDKYEPNRLDLRLADTHDIVKSHDYPDRYRTVEIGTLDSAQPALEKDPAEWTREDRPDTFTVHGIWDTINGEIVEDTSGEFESVIHDMVIDHFPMRDSIELARLSKPTRQLTIIDDNSGNSLSPKEVLSASKMGQ